MEKKNMKGYKGIQLLPRALENQIEFTKFMCLDNMESVRQFVGDDYEITYMPQKTRAVLVRFDFRTIHCAIALQLRY
jgi:hypothetical protein